VVYSLVYSKGMSQCVYRDIQWSYVDWDSVVGIATPYTLDGPGIESWWGQDLPHPLGLALGPTHLL
jgi:hypothetical protein